MTISQRYISSVLTKLRFVLAFLVICLSGLAGLADDVEPSESELNILADTSTERVFAKLAELFETKFPEYSVNILVNPGGVTRENYVRSLLVSDVAPDIVLYNVGSLMWSLEPEETLYSLSNEEFAARIRPEFHLAASVQNNLYAIPFGSALGGGILYNVELYERLGLKPPNDWRGFLENMRDISHTGSYGMVLSLETSWTTQILFLADFHNVMAKNPSFAQQLTDGKLRYETSSEARRSFEKMQDIHALGYVNPNAQTTNFETAIKMVVNGEAGHYPALTGAVAEAEKISEDAVEKVGFFAIPSDEIKAFAGLTLWMPRGLYLPKKAHNPTAAKAFLNMVLTQQGCEALEEYGFMAGPAVVDGCILKAPHAKAARDFNEIYKNSTNSVPALEFLTSLKGPSLEVITTQLLTGEVDADEAAQLYDRDLERRALELGLSGWK